MNCSPKQINIKLKYKNGSLTYDYDEIIELKNKQINKQNIMKYISWVQLLKEHRNYSLLQFGVN